MTPGPSFSSRFAAQLIDYAAGRGADRDTLRALAGIAPHTATREDVRIPCDAMARAWATAIDQTSDPCLALHLGTSAAFSANRTTELIMETSSTVIEAFRLAVRYADLIADVMRVELGEADGRLYIEFDPRPAWRAQPIPVQRDCLHITYVACIRSLQRLIGTPQPPSLLTFTFPRPASPRVYYETFDCAVTFGAAWNRIGFAADLESRRVVTRDPSLKAVIRQYAETIRQRIRREGETTRAVMDAVARQMSPAPPPLGTVARALGLSTRSLQRRLSAEGRTYRAVVEEVRLEAAERHLRETTHSLDEVAFLSGYADTSSFVRAFKRSRGQPPRRFLQDTSRRAAPG